MYEHILLYKCMTQINRKIFDNIKIQLGVKMSMVYIYGLFQFQKSTSDLVYSPNRPHDFFSIKSYNTFIL